MTVRRLNHAVMYVRDARRAADFYRDVLGFETVQADPSGRAVFLRAAGSANHHDLGLFGIGATASGPVPGAVGLYHLAWQVDTIDDLVALARRLGEAGALVGASDHGASKSLYARDPDGNEFEVMWAVPSDSWGEYATQAVVQPLDLMAEVDRWTGVRTAALS